MGKKRRHKKDRALQETAAPLVGSQGNDGWFLRFAVAFLVIYLLLMLLANHDTKQ